MQKSFRRIFQVGLLAGLLLAATGAQAQSSLDGTSWKPNGDCFLSRVDFKTGGTVNVSFNNDDTDVGDWDIGVVIVKIKLDRFADYFLGTYKNNILQLGHLWIDPDDTPHSEVCTFSQV